MINTLHQLQRRSQLNAVLAFTVPRKNSSYLQTEATSTMAPRLHFHRFQLTLNNGHTRRSHAPDPKNPQICMTPRRLSVRFDSVLLFLLKLLGPLIKLLQQFNNCKVQWAFSLRFLPFTTFNLFYKRTKWCERKKPHETASSWFPVLRFL